MDYETIIGLEVHAQLLAKSKMFCSCRADYQNASPNTRVCPVCLGMPGTLPVINRKAVEYVIMTGLAFDCSISSKTKFDRKNYPYPDLMKGYQISQYDLPIASEGHLDIGTDAGLKRVGIIRVHLEEDVAKLQHVRNDFGQTYSLVDVNRAGAPLMEIVSYPDMRSPEEARNYLMSVRAILQYLGVSTGNMEQGSFRCDANVSIRSKGSSGLMARTEVKNMNSFSAVFNALVYEVERQIQLVEKGRSVVQETRGWVDGRGVTVSQRSKEYAHDYRYFPDPDLPPVSIGSQWVEEIQSLLPELPVQRRQRFMDQYGLPSYDTRLLTGQKDTADFFEEVMDLSQTQRDHSKIKAKSVSNWMLGDLSGLLNSANLGIVDSSVTPAHLAELVNLIDSGVLSTVLAKNVLEEAFKTGKLPEHIVKEKGYTQISDISALDVIVEETIKSNPKAVSDYLAGKETASRFLIGQVMKLTKGKANPDIVNNLIIEKLEVLKAVGNTSN